MTIKLMCGKRFYEVEEETYWEANHPESTFPWADLPFDLQEMVIKEIVPINALPDVLVEHHINNPKCECYLNYYYDWTLDEFLFNMIHDHIELEKEKQGFIKPIDISQFIDFIYLTVAERCHYAKIPHEYLINQLAQQ